jgi:alkaline phosphatase D
MPDTQTSTSLTTIGFGSCNNVKKGPQNEIWSSLTKRKFDLWIWGGDAIYALGGKDIPALKRAYEEILNIKSPYLQFVQSLPAGGGGGVIGTFDDHDGPGINDFSGAVFPLLPDLQQRQQMYQDFLHVPIDSPLRKRKGIYSSHVFGEKQQNNGISTGSSGGQVKIILLDTRTGRSDYIFPPSSLGSILQGNFYAKPFPLIAAALRVVSAYLRFPQLLDMPHRRMLDDEQWRWLENELKQSKADVHVLVSSVQVLTNTPSVESWGHFWLERKRLFSLLNTIQPKGLIILSGDVHIAEVLRVGNATKPIEITSSGLTHSCVGTLPTNALCNFAWKKAFSWPNRQDIFIGRNFAQLSLDWKKRKFNISIYDFEPPHYAPLDKPPVLVVERDMDSNWNELFPKQWIGHEELIPGIIPSETTSFIFVLVLIFCYGFGIWLLIRLSMIVGGMGRRNR